MDELLRALKHFITRDIVFLVGGGSVVTAFLYACNRMPTPRDHVVLYFLLAGIAYVIGYAVQDAFCLSPFVTTTAPRKLNRYLAWFYKRYVREDWRDIAPNVDFKRAEEAISSNEFQRVQLERLITLQQVGTTVGPCALVSGILLGVVAQLRATDTFVLKLAVGAVVLGAVLVHLGWIKCGQQARYLADRDPGPKT